MVRHTKRSLSLTGARFVEGPSVGSRGPCCFSIRTLEDDEDEARRVSVPGLNAYGVGLVQA